jgi:hypothetical protein
MELLSYDRYYAAIEAETARIAEVAASADLAAPVPTCPGWTLTKLVTHVGRVVWEHGHGKADVAVRGTAADLLLMLYRRLPPAAPGIEILGDEGLLSHWLDHSAF